MEDMHSKIALLLVPAHRFHRLHLLQFSKGPFHFCFRFLFPATCKTPVKGCEGSTQTLLESLDCKHRFGILQEILIGDLVCAFWLTVAWITPWVAGSVFCRIVGRAVLVQEMFCCLLHAQVLAWMQCSTDTYWFVQSSAALIAYHLCFCRHKVPSSALDWWSAA